MKKNYTYYKFIFFPVFMLFGGGSCNMANLPYNNVPLSPLYLFYNTQSKSTIPSTDVGAYNSTNQSTIVYNNAALMFSTSITPIYNQGIYVCTDTFNSNTFYMLSTDSTCSGHTLGNNGVPLGYLANNNLSSGFYPVYALTKSVSGSNGGYTFIATEDANLVTQLVTVNGFTESTQILGYTQSLTPNTPVYNFINSSTNDYLQTSNISSLAIPSGYNILFPIESFRVSNANVSPYTTELYSCKITQSPYRHFVSPYSDCEGNGSQDRTFSPIGYVAPCSGPNPNDCVLPPLWRIQNSSLSNYPFATLFQNQENYFIQSRGFSYPSPSFIYGSFPQ